MTRFLSRALAVIALALLGACASFGGGGSGGPGAYATVVAKTGDTARSIAEKYLGDAGLYWIVEDVNGVDAVKPGAKLFVPDGPFQGVAPEPGVYQTVPILTYHRFTAGKYKGERLELSGADFDKQLTYLEDHGYRVITMKQLGAYLASSAPIPRRAVVITIDDGYRNAYTVAYPVLKKHAMPATIYVYSDFVGAGAALTWDEMREMLASGLIDIQPHSKTHSNMSEKTGREDEAAYKKRVETELSVPAKIFEQKLGVRAYTFAYPYGAVTSYVADRARAEGYETGVTVLRGANPPFSDPMLLHRTMIYGDDSISRFSKALETEAEY